MADSQILNLNKGLQLFDVEAGKILEKVTEYSRLAIELGASD